jgi:hypothetical protein
MWTSIVRGSRYAESPHTRESSMSRVKTRPGERARAERISNSTKVVATLSPLRVTVRFVESIRRPRTSIGCSSSVS